MAAAVRIEAGHDEHHERIAAVVARHEHTLLRVARQHSLCDDDALDAYQRALEIFVRRVATVNAATEVAWLKVVVRHEAMAIRRARSQLVASDDVDLDAVLPIEARSVEDQRAATERVRQSAEALRALKPDEAKALVMKAHGLSYDEIGARYGWTYTKVNRSITEGRRRFLDAYEGIDSGRHCDQFADTLRGARRWSSHATPAARDPASPPPLRGMPVHGRRAAPVPAAARAAVPPAREREARGLRAAASIERVGRGARSAGRVRERRRASGDGRRGAGPLRQRRRRRDGLRGIGAARRAAAEAGPERDRASRAEEDHRQSSFRQAARRQVRAHGFHDPRDTGTDRNTARVERLVEAATQRTQARREDRRRERVRLRADHGGTSRTTAQASSASVSAASTRPAPSRPQTPAPPSSDPAAAEFTP